MKLTTKEKAINAFVKSAIGHSNASEVGNYKLANKNFNTITKAAKFLKAENYIEELIQLLNHENIGVQIWASTYLLDSFECLAKEKLKVIEMAELPHYSFTAKMTLEEWEKGNLKLQYK